MDRFEHFLPIAENEDHIGEAYSKIGLTSVLNNKILTKMFMF